jgi:type IV secretion system protein VirB10
MKNSATRSDDLITPQSHQQDSFLEEDTPSFQAEVQHAKIQRDTKIKLIFIVVLIVFMVACILYLKHYFSEKLKPNLNNTNNSSNEDAVAQRKTKTFDALPPIAKNATSTSSSAFTLANSFNNTSSIGAPITPITIPIELPKDYSNKLPTNGTANLNPFNFQVNPPLTNSTPSSTLGMMLPTISIYPPTNNNNTNFPNTPNNALIKPLTPNTVDVSALSAVLSNTSLENKLNNNTHITRYKNSPEISTVEQQAQANRTRSNTPLTATAQISAAQLGSRSFVLTKGSFIPCVLETQLISNVFGMTSCIVTHHVYSDDGKIILLERGSKATGNYGSNLRNGDTRLAVVWDRIKSPKGVVIDINSPASDGLGAMGVNGSIDKHWFERIGGAVLLSLLQDTVQYAGSSLAYHNYIKEQKNLTASQNQLTSNSEQTSTTITDPKTGISTTVTKQSSNGPLNNNNNNSNSQLASPPIFGAQNTSKQGGVIAEQVLSASINAAPTLYKNRGDLVYIFVANDLWFDSVYQLEH